MKIYGGIFLFLITCRLLPHKEKKKFRADNHEAADHNR